MHNNQYCKLVTILLLASIQSIFCMIDEKRDKNLSLLTMNADHAKSFVPGILSAGLQRTAQGRICFNPPEYERYLNRRCFSNNNQPVPPQALYMANSAMIRAIITQRNTRLNDKGYRVSDTLSSRFIHLQHAIIYCEMARELLKQQVDHSPDISLANIRGLQRLAQEQYARTYGRNSLQFKKAIHIAHHRWNMCPCSDFYTAPLIRKP